MHIKEVSIGGFRSFRSQQEPIVFHPKHNVVVGPNGAGKTSFFDAIQFALMTPRFQSLRQDERRGLLHEGSGDPAFVQVVFDNTDGRMAQDGDEVVLRRTIGLKKDEFFLNRKRVTKSEVSSLLESAGLSKSNPYYIVQQGRVRELTTMRDDRRLDLLKEVAGTNVYEERRDESMKIMEDTHKRRDKIQEVIDYIETRLSELEEEKAELGAYQELDRTRRALQYTLYDRELTTARQELSILEDSRQEDVSRANELHDELRGIQESIAEKETRLAEAVIKAERLEASKVAAEEERREIIVERAKIELQVKNMAERVAADAEGQVSLAAEAEALHLTIAERETELERTVEPAYATAQAALQRTERELAEANALQDELYERQGRHSRFQSPAERDASLREQSASLQQNASTLRMQIAAAREASEKLSLTEKAHKMAAAEIERDIVARHEQIARLSADIAEKTETRNSLAEDRKQRWGQLEALSDKMGQLRQDVDKGHRALRAGTSRAIVKGLEAVAKIALEEGISGYKGSLIENFDLKEPQYAAAVEAAAGNSLFHVVVDTDSTAAALMERLEERKLGRLTFMPLNRLRPKEQSYPDSQDVAPLMLTALEYKDEVKPAIQQVFGRKLLARNLEVAGQFAPMSGMDCITMDGDEVGRKGALQGGYKDTTRSRLLAMASIREAEVALEDAEKEHAQLKDKAAQVDQAVTNVLGELQRTEAKRASIRHIIAEQAKQLDLEQQGATAAAQRALAELERVPSLEAEAGNMESKASLLESEVGTPLQVGLSEEDSASLQTLVRDTLPRLNNELRERCAVLEDAANSRQRILALLRDNLFVRRRELAAVLDPVHGGVGSSDRAAQAEQRREALARARCELAASSRALEDNRARLAAQERELLTLKQDSRQLADELDQLKGREGGDGDALAEATKVAEKLLNKRALLLQRREDSMRKIQSLGSLPSTEMANVAHLGGKELMKKLHQTNEKLKDYSHVNKKALDQYVNFSEQRSTLLERKAELDSGACAIKDLIAALDQQKDEAILRTFRGVAQHFETVFRELVPHGQGKLVMRTSLAADTGTESEMNDAGAAEDGEGEESSRDLQKVNISSFTGVEVKVRFSPTERAYTMAQLSGGQQTLVALTLLFAIQRCDPAPFYLFDEIDSNLDSNYRAAVASLIRRQASDEEAPAQFITSTFHREFVQVASQALCITLQNKVRAFLCLREGCASSLRV
jgi:structural maintenance of chromosome 3 (chondroitin sulfate proteoglycan 6)